MPKKSDLLEQAKASGVVAADAVEDDYTGDDLKALLSGDEVVKHVVHKEPIVAADGHVVLSQEDIDARQ